MNEYRAFNAFQVRTLVRSHPKHRTCLPRKSILSGTVGERNLSLTGPDIVVLHGFSANPFAPSTVLMPSRISEHRFKLLPHRKEEGCLDRCCSDISRAGFLWMQLNCNK